MNIPIEPRLYTDPQRCRPLGRCPVCGGECYPPGGRCIRCERRIP